MISVRLYEEFHSPFSSYWYGLTFRLLFAVVVLLDGLGALYFCATAPKSCTQNAPNRRPARKPSAPAPEISHKRRHGDILIENLSPSMSSPWSNLPMSRSPQIELYHVLRNTRRPLPSASSHEKNWDGIKITKSIISLRRDGFVHCLPGTAWPVSNRTNADSGDLRTAVTTIASNSHSCHARSQGFTFSRS